MTLKPRSFRKQDETILIFQVNMNLEKKKLVDHKLSDTKN